MTSFLKATKLVTANGTIQEPLAKTLALYFAADWCPDCRDFQPILNDFYTKVNATSHVFDIVFVSSDANEEDQLIHFREKHGSWLAIPFNDPLRDELKRKYKICAKKEMEQLGLSERIGGIPTIVIVNDQGDIIDIDGVSKIEQQGINALDSWCN